VETWQLKEYLKGKGMKDDTINEEMSAVSAAPAPGLSTLGNVSGMGNPSPPKSDGATNAGFYNMANSGSGDKFSSVNAGTQSAKDKKKHAKTIKNYVDFIKSRKKEK
jgi:pectin methylesterase-like acyl-CoA thioesterase